MANRPLAFESLTVDRLLGIRTPDRRLHLGEPPLSPGINLVYGPNASGKTTVARALGAILWPETLADRFASLHAAFRLDGHRWETAVEGDRPRSWQRDGQPAQAPSLPATTQAKNYSWSLHELLTEEDQDLARAVQRQVYGGVDLDEAIAALAFTDPVAPSTNVKPHGQWQACRERVERARAHQQELLRQQGQLADLEEQVAAARAASDTVTLVANALAWRQAQSDLQAARARHDAQPSVLAHLTGDEPDRLAALDQEIDTLGQQLTEGRRLEAVAQAQLADAGGSGQPLGSDQVEELTARYETWQRRVEEALRLRRELAGFRKTEREARQRLGDAIADDRLSALAALDPKPYRAYAASRQKLLAAETKVNALRGVAEPVATEAAARLSSLDRGIDRLRGWLQQVPPAAAPPRPPTASTLWLLAGGLVAAILGLAVAVHWAWLLALTLPVAALLLRPPPPPLPAPDARLSYREDYLRLDLAPPDAWEPEAIKRRLDQHQAEADTLRIKVARQQHVEALLAPIQDLLPRLRDRVAQERRRLQADLGLDLDDADELELVMLVEKISHWLGEHTEAERLAAALTETEAQAAAARDTFNASAIACGASPVDDPPAASSLVQSLSRRLLQCRDAEALARQATAAIADAEQHLAKRRRERRDLLAHCDVADTDEPDSDRVAVDQVRLLVSRLDHYRQAQRQLTEAEVRAADARRRLTESAGFAPEIETCDHAELVRRREAAAQTADTLEDVQRHLLTTRNELARARQGHDLEAALQEQAEAEAAIRQLRDGCLDRAAGSLIVAHLRERSQRHASAVLSRTNELLAAITVGRYAIHPGGDPPVFLATDRTTGKTHSLAELSSGTRVQILLAVRMAFVQQQEGDGPRLPIFLDEVLGNSDDRRAEAIVQTVIALAREGRQVFYFTAQADEVGKWQQLLAACPEVPWRAIPLGEAPPVDALPPPTPEPHPVPAPNGDNYLAYGNRLGVSPIAPWEPVGTLHLWHLLDEAETLYRCLRAGIERWGQVETIVAAGGPAMLVTLGVTESPTLLPRLQARAQAIDLALTLWRQGRGRPVDREALANSGAITDTFLDPVTDLAAALHGDARAILAALERGDIKGFRGNKREELRDYLSQQDYLSPDEPLSRQELRDRLLGRLADELSAGLLDLATVDAILRALPLPEVADVDP